MQKTLAQVQQEFRMDLLAAILSRIDTMSEEELDQMQIRIDIARQNHQGKKSGG